MPEPGREVPIGLLPEDWGNILAVLGQLPYHQVATLIDKINVGLKAASKEAPATEG